MSIFNESLGEAPLYPPSATPIQVDQKPVAWMVESGTGIRTFSFQKVRQEDVAPLGTVVPLYAHPYNPYTIQPPTAAPVPVSASAGGESARSARVVHSIGGVTLTLDIHVTAVKQ